MNGILYVFERLHTEMDAYNLTIDEVVLSRKSYDAVCSDLLCTVNYGSEGIKELRICGILIKRGNS